MTLISRHDGAHEATGCDQSGLASDTGAPRSDRPAIIRVLSEQWSNGSWMPAVTLTTEGRLRERDGAWEVVYDESEATGLDNTTTTITLSDNGMVRLLRSGDVEMDMCFHEGQHHLSKIRMPYGLINFRLTTNEARGHLDARGGKVALSYTLDFDNESVVETKLNMTVDATDRPHDKTDAKTPPEA